MFKKVLYVEDEQYYQDFYAGVVASQGALVSIAPDSTQGLVCVDQDHYDLIILDTSLPIEEAWAILEHIRQSMNNEETPLILMGDFGRDHLEFVERSKPFGIVENHFKIELLLDEPPGEFSQKVRRLLLL